MLHLVSSREKRGLFTFPLKTDPQKYSETMFDVEEQNAKGIVLLIRL